MNTGVRPRAAESKKNPLINIKNAAIPTDVGPIDGVERVYVLCTRFRRRRAAAQVVLNKGRGGGVAIVLSVRLRPKIPTDYSATCSKRANDEELGKNETIFGI